MSSDLYLDVDSDEDDGTYRGGFPVNALGWRDLAVTPHACPRTTGPGGWGSPKRRAEDGVPGGIVTERVVLEASGEDCLVNVTQLILRDRRVSTFDPEVASALPALSSLGLSHNAVTSLASFGRFG